MDFSSLITIALVIVAAYFLIKFVVSPVIRTVLGIVSFLIIIYFLQRFFGFDSSKILSPFGINLNLNKLDSNFGWILGPTNYYIGLAKTFFAYIWGNFPKSLNK